MGKPRKGHSFEKNVINRSQTGARQEGSERRGQRRGVRKEGPEKRDQKGRFRKEGL